MTQGGRGQEEARDYPDAGWGNLTQIILRDSNNFFHRIPSASLLKTQSRNRLELPLQG